MSKQDASDEWLARLSGHEPAHAESDVARLRNTIIDSEARLHRQIDATHESEMQAVLRLRQSLARVRFQRKSLVRRVALPAAFAASLILAGAWYLLRFSETPSPTVLLGDRIDVRSKPFAIRIDAADPHAAAESLRDELDRAQILTHLSSDGGRYYLFVVLDSRTSPVIGKDLVEGGITLKPGSNRIEIARDR